MEKITINLDDFKKVDIVAGTIIEASVNQGAKKPAYILRPLHN